MAFIYKDTYKSKTRYRIGWQDATKGPKKKGRRWAGCSHGNHKDAFDAADWSPGERAAFANGATTKRLREQLVKAYQALEELKRTEAVQAGGAGKGSRYDTVLLDLIDGYLENMEKDTLVREQSGGRAGKSPGTLAAYKESATKLRHFLEGKGLQRITTGELEAEHLRDFRDHLVRSKAYRTKGKKIVKVNRLLSTATVNRHLRQLKAMINHFLDDDDRRPYFHSSARSLAKALKQVTEDRGLPERFKPDQLQAFLAKALEQGDLCFRWTAVLMLTGCRVHEAAGLKWKDVDLEDGSIIYRSKKTGRDRVLLLADPSAEVSPGLLALLKKWKSKRGKGLWVLPANANDGSAVFPKKPWEKLRKVVDIKAKALRSNWASYMAALGRPPTTIALMAGHSPLVLEKHYLAFARARLNGTNLDEAMGIQGLLLKALTDL